MSHLRQPPFWRIFLIPPGFLPRGNAQNLCKSPILRTKPTSSKRRQSEENDRNFTLFDPSRWRKCLATELRIRPLPLVEDLLFWDLKCGKKSAHFSDFWAFSSEPETASLIEGKVFFNKNSKLFRAKFTLQFVKQLKFRGAHE